jgi:hypothetical protein
MAWAAGTDATNNLKTVLLAWLEGRLAAAPFKARLPRRSLKFAAPKGTEKIAGSIKVLLYTGADENPPHEFDSDDGRVMEEYHRVTIDVKSDEKGAKADETAKVASIIRQILSSPTERQTLIGLGVFNIRESADALELDGVEFNRPINLTCTTDTLLD